MEYSVYARVDSLGRVIYIFSTLFEQPNYNDVFIKKGTGDEFAYPSSSYQLYDDKSRLNYKAYAGQMVLRTEDEKNLDPDYINSLRDSGYGRIENLYKDRMSIGIDFEIPDMGRFHFLVDDNLIYEMQILKERIDEGATSVMWRDDLIEMPVPYTDIQFKALYRGVWNFVSELKMHSCALRQYVKELSESTDNNKYNLIQNLYWDTTFSETLQQKLDEAIQVMNITE